MDENPNRVLNARPPPLCDSEKSLPQVWRATLSQLRSGFCRLLKSYDSLVKNNDNDRCPECLVESHTTAHLFECPAAPSQLYKIDLWSNPIHAASFLSRLSSFSALPRVAPPDAPLAPRPIVVPLRPPPAPPPPSPSLLSLLSFDDDIFNLYGSESSSSESLCSADRDIFDILNSSGSSAFGGSLNSLNSADQEVFDLLNYSSSQ